jgi:hypothetical protein
MLNNLNKGQKMKKTLEKQVINSLKEFITTNSLISMQNIEIKEIYKNKIFEFWGIWNDQKKLCFTLKLNFGRIYILLDGGKFYEILNRHNDYANFALACLEQLLIKIDCYVEFESHDCLVIFHDKVKTDIFETIDHLERRQLLDAQMNDY